MMRSLRSFGTVLALGLAVACGGEEAPPQPTTLPPPAAPSEAGGSDTGGAEPSPQPAPSPGAAVAPTQEGGGAAEGAAAQAASYRGDAERGRALYASYCASCHGAGGAGDGPAAAALQPKPAAHTDAAYMNALSDEHVFKVIQGGGPAVGKSPLMAPWGGTLDDQQIRDLVAFVRTLAKS